MKKLLVIVIGLLVLLSGCNWTVNEPEEYRLQPQDPDPTPNPVPEIPPEVEEDLSGYFGVINLEGEIRGFNLAHPEDFTVLAVDASTEDLGQQIKISPNGEHLLYNRVSGDNESLVLVNVPSKEILMSKDRPTAEIQFLDDSNLVFSIGGKITNYSILEEEEVELVNHPTFGCDHHPSFSEDLSHFVAKNQTGSKLPTLFQADYDPDDPASAVVTSLAAPISFDPEYGDEERVDLNDDLFVTWVNSDIENPGTHLIYKNRDGFLPGVMTYDINASLANYVTLEDENGREIRYSKIAISPDSRWIIFYGGRGVYILDNDTEEFESSEISVRTLYYSDNFNTMYAAFTPDSDYVVLGNYSWIGVYNIETGREIPFDSEAVIPEDQGSSNPRFHANFALSVSGSR